MPAPSSHRGALGRLVAACAIVFACCVAGVVAVGANELHATARALEAQPRVELDGVLTTHDVRQPRGDAVAAGRSC